MPSLEEKTTPLPARPRVTSQGHASGKLLLVLLALALPLAGGCQKDTASQARAGDAAGAAEDHDGGQDDDAAGGNDQGPGPAAGDAGTEDSGPAIPGWEATLSTDGLLRITKPGGETLLEGGAPEILAGEETRPQRLIGYGACQTDQHGEFPAAATMPRALAAAWHSHCLVGDGLTFDWYVAAYADKPAFTMRLLVTASGHEPIRILRMSPLVVDAEEGGGFYPSPDPKNLRLLDNGSNILADVAASLHPGDEKRNFLADSLPIEARGNIIADWNAGALDLQTGDNFAAGFLTFDHSFPVIGLAYSEEDHPVAGGAKGYNLLAAENILLFHGKVLNPGEQLWSELFYFDPAAADAFAALEGYADAVHDTLGIVTWLERDPQRRVPNGWNSWTGGGGDTGGYGTDINAEIIAANLAVMRDDFKPFGIEYFQMDDGYQVATGDWRFNTSRFPNGIDDYLAPTQEAGLRTGLWVSAFQVAPEAPLAAENPALLSEAEEGFPQLVVPTDQHPLDLSNPAALDFLREVFGNFARYGIAWYKLDFTYYAVLAKLKYNPALTSMEAFRRGLKTIREAVGPEPFLLGIGVMGANAGLVDGMRLTTDNGPRWESPEDNSLLATPRSFHSILRTGAKRYYLHNRVWLNHNDLLFFRAATESGVPPLTLIEARTFAGFVGFSGSIVKIGDKLVELSDEAKQVIRKLLPVYGPSARPLDLFLREYPETWVLPVPQSHQGARLEAVALGLFNWGTNWDYSANPATAMPESARAYSFKRSELELPASGAYLVREFWTGETSLWESGNFEISVPARDSRVLIFRPLANRPQFAGHNRQLTQGGTDLLDETWNAAEKILTLTLQLDAAGTTGLPFQYELSFHVPAPFSYAAARLEGVEAQDFQAEQIAEMVSVKFTPSQPGAGRVILEFE